MACDLIGSGNHPKKVHKVWKKHMSVFSDSVNGPTKLKTVVSLKIILLVITEFELSSIVTLPMDRSHCDDNEKWHHFLEATVCSK